MDADTIRNITIYYSEGFAEKFRKIAFIVSGFSIKDAGALDLFDKIVGKGTAKRYDIYIDIETIEQSCKLAERIYEAFYPGKKYFTSYDYPMPPKLIKLYKEQVKLITPESIHCYLRGQ